MSGRTILVIGAVVLVLIVAGVVLYFLLQSQPVMANGPGMLYFYSPV
jgi:hypothetical protein